MGTVTLETPDALRLRLKARLAERLTPATVASAATIADDESAQAA